MNDTNWFGPNSLRELLSKEKELANTKANKDDVYNKEEVDGFIDAKADKSDTYTMTEVDGLIDSKADKTDIYTKTEVDTKVDVKADKADTYTKIEVDTAVNAKADKADVYNREQIDTAINAKANKTDVYTKTEVDTAVSSKADKSDVYTKTETDTALGKKANKTDVYTQSEMNTKLYGKVDKVTGKGLSTNDYTTAEKTKLAGLSNYTLPTATSTKLGGVKIGNGININNGVISVDSSVGKVQSVNGHTGTVVLTAGDLDAYTKSEVNTAVSGKVDKEDGKTLSSNDFTDDEKTKLAGLENYTLPTASKEELGGVKIGNGLDIQNGVVSVTGGGTGGSSVIPNPQDEATDKLTKLKIENNTYSVGTSNISMDVVGDKLIVGGDGSELFNIKMIEYDGTGETPTVIQFPETPKYILEISGYTKPFNNAFVRHPGFVPQEYNCGFMIYTKNGEGVQAGSYEFDFNTNQLKISGFSDLGARLNALGSKARVYYI